MADDNDRIYSKLEKIEGHLGEINVTLARNTDSLEVHVRRTDALERIVLPIKNVYDYGVMTVKILGTLSVLAIIVEGTVALLTYLRK